MLKFIQMYTNHFYLHSLSLNKLNNFLIQQSNRNYLCFARNIKELIYCVLKTLNHSHLEILLLIKLIFSFKKLSIL